MSDFLEKLKRGMDIEEDVQPETPEPETHEPEVLAEKPVEPEITLTATRVEPEPFEKPKRKRTRKKKKKEIKVKESPIKVNENFSQKDGQLTIDVFETDRDVVIQSAVAGIDPEDLDISIEKDMVSIRGKRERSFEEKSENFFYQECYWGSFSREIVLPAEVDSSKADASMEKGILTIRVPKKKSTRTKKIDIKSID